MTKIASFDRLCTTIDAYIAGRILIPGCPSIKIDVTSTGRYDLHCCRGVYRHHGEHSDQKETWASAHLED
jgi:hypothetical protein